LERQNKSKEPERNDENNEHGTTIGGIHIDSSPTVEQFQGLPLESLTHGPIDLVIEEERERIERTKELIEDE
jgi:hypothetical protein